MAKKFPTQEERHLINQAHSALLLLIDDGKHKKFPNWKKWREWARSQVPSFDWQQSSLKTSLLAIGAEKHQFLSTAKAPERAVEVQELRGILLAIYDLSQGEQPSNPGFLNDLGEKYGLEVNFGEVEDDQDSNLFSNDFDARVRGGAEYKQALGERPLH